MRHIAQGKILTRGGSGLSGAGSAGFSGPNFFFSGITSGVSVCVSLSDLAFFLGGSCVWMIAEGTSTPVEATTAAVVLLMVSPDSSCASTMARMSSSSIRLLEARPPAAAIFRETSSMLSNWMAYLLQRYAHFPQSATVNHELLSLEVLDDASRGTRVPGAVPGARRHCRDCLVLQNLHSNPLFRSAALSLSKAESSWSSATSSRSFTALPSLCLLSSAFLFSFRDRRPS